MLECLFRVCTLTNMFDQRLVLICFKLFQSSTMCSDMKWSGVKNNAALQQIERNWTDVMGGQLELTAVSLRVSEGDGCDADSWVRDKLQLTNDIVHCTCTAVCAALHAQTLTVVSTQHNTVDMHCCVCCPACSDTDSCVNTTQHISDVLCNPEITFHYG